MAVSNFKVNGTISPLKKSGEANPAIYTFIMPAEAAVIRGTLTPSGTAAEFLDNLDEEGVTDAFDNTLQALNIAQGALIPAGGISDDPEPAFDSAITEYTTTIPFSAYPALVTATPNNSEAKVNVVINPTTLDGAGEFTVTVEVTSLFWTLYPKYESDLPEGGSETKTKTYTVTGTRTAGDSTTTLITLTVPQAGVLQQDSSSVYAGTVSSNISKLDIIAAATHPNARVQVIDNGLGKPATAENNILVQVNAPGIGAGKSITVRVSAEDGTSADNTINIYRDGSIIAYNAAGGIVNLIKNEDAENEYYEIHTFMADPDTPLGGQTEYTLNFTQKPANDKVEVLVVAGGGGGGHTGSNDTDIKARAGGGGAGGFLYHPAYDISDKGSSFAVKVGAGGAVENNGGNSTFGSDFTANGGGSGGRHTYGNPAVGNPGGSGGGGSSTRSGGEKNSGTAPEGALNLGSTGSTGKFDWSGGGGGGAESAGNTPTGSYRGANGGSGTLSAISGTLSWYAGGGAGGAEIQYNDGPEYGAGQGNSGEAGTGDGGSGGGGVDGKGNGGNGGSGIVIVRWSWVATEITPE
jgi:hypothetical protein